MKTSTTSLRESLLRAGSAVVSADPRWVDELTRLLTAEGFAPPARVESFEQAEAEAMQWPERPLWIDLRSDERRGSPAGLLDRLARRNGRRGPVIGVGDVTFAPAWANQADQGVHGVLRFPFQRGEFLELLQSEKLARRVYETPPLVDPRRIDIGAFQYVTYTPGMFEMLEHLERVAAHDVTLLLIGETGTGKTTIARLVHELSNRRGEPFLTVACGSLPRELIESELFGHVRGAFTSADRSKIGKFEAAGRGSLLLDEIDVLGLLQQTKLLRVIESGEFEPVGSNETQISRARLIVASNVDLKELMDRDEFRADLYYRLNVLEFHVPPLRERPRDIVPLTLGFIDEFAATHGISVRRIRPDFLATLKSYDWPGNIRELKNHIRRAVLFCRDGELTVQDLAIGLLQPRTNGSAGSSSSHREATSLSERVASTEQEILEAALRANGFHRTATAQSLGISRVGLYKKMRKYGLLGAQRSRPSILPAGAAPSASPSSQPASGG